MKNKYILLFEEYIETQKNLCIILIKGGIYDNHYLTGKYNDYDEVLETETIKNGLEPQDLSDTKLMVEFSKKDLYMSTFIQSNLSNPAFEIEKTVFEIYDMVQSGEVKKVETIPASKYLNQPDTESTIDADLPF